MLKRIVFAATLGVFSCVPLQPAKDAESPASDAPAEPSFAAAELLPSATLALVATGDLLGTVDRLGRAVIVRRMRAEHERFAFRTIETTGVDLTDPEELGRMGIDVHGEAALAWIDQDLTGIIVTLADPPRFKSEIYRMFARRHDSGPELAGDAVVLANYDGAVILRGRSALLLIGYTARERARAIASIEPERSLASHGPFRAALKDVDPHSEVRAYVDPRAIYFMLNGLDPRERGMTRAESLHEFELDEQRALEQARTRGDSVAGIVAIDDAFRAARERMSDEPYARAARRIAGGVDGLGVGIALRRDGFDLSGAVSLREDSPWRRTLANAPALPLLSSLAERPALFASAAFEPSLMSSELDGWFAVGARRPERLGADLLQETARALDGRVGVAATFADARADGDGDLKSRLMLAAMAGLADVEAARRVLDRVAAWDAGLAKTSEGWTLSLGELAPLYLRITGKLLVAAQDPAVAARAAKAAAPIASPERSRGRRGEKKNALAAIAPGDDALDFAVDIGAAALFFNRWSGVSEGGRVRIAPSDAGGQETEEELAAARELDSVDADLAALRRDTNHHRDLTIGDALKKLGMVALAAHETDSGFHLTARYATGGKHPAAAFAEARRVLALSDDDDPILRAAAERTRRLLLRRESLEEKLYELQALRKR